MGNCLTATEGSPKHGPYNNKSKKAKSPASSDDSELRDDYDDPDSRKPEPKKNNTSQNNNSNHSINNSNNLSSPSMASDKILLPPDSERLSSSEFSPHNNKKLLSPKNKQSMIPEEEAHSLNNNNNSFDIQDIKAQQNESNQINQDVNGKQRPKQNKANKKNKHKANQNNNNKPEEGDDSTQNLLHLSQFLSIKPVGPDSSADLVRTPFDEPANGDANQVPKQLKSAAAAIFGVDIDNKTKQPLVEPRSAAVNASNQSAYTNNNGVNGNYVNSNNANSNQQKLPHSFSSDDMFGRNIPNNSSSGNIPPNYATSSKTVYHSNNTTDNKLNILNLFPTTDLAANYENDRLSFMRYGGKFTAHIFIRKRKTPRTMQISLYCPDINSIIISSDSGSIAFNSPTHQNGNNNIAISPTSMDINTPNSSFPSNNTNSSSSNTLSQHPVLTQSSHSVTHDSQQLIDVSSGFYDISPDQLTKHKRKCVSLDDTCCFTIFFANLPPLYLEARSTEDKNQWITALLWLKDTCNKEKISKQHDIPNNNKLDISHPNNISNDKKNKPRNTVMGPIADNHKTGNNLVVGRTRASSAAGSPNTTLSKDDAKAIQTQIANGSHANNPNNAAISQDKTKDVKQLTVSVNKNNAFNGSNPTKDLTDLLTGGVNNSNPDLLTGTNSKITTASDNLAVNTPLPVVVNEIVEQQNKNVSKPDKWRSLLLNGQVFNYFHHRHSTSELIYVSISPDLQMFRYGRINNNQINNNNIYTVQFASNFNYSHNIPTASLSQILTGDKCPLFGVQKFPFSLIFTNYKDRENKIKQMNLSIDDGTLKEDWVRSLKWLREQKSNIGMPFDVRRVAYLDTNLNWQGSNMLDQFQLGELIGKGGFASVYLGTHKSTHGKFAIKIFNNLNVTIQNEINILKEVRHEHCVSYFGCYQSEEENGKMYVVMEYCDAGSLADLLKKAKEKLREKHLSYTLRCTLLALQYLHSKNIIHRDIKAANILLTKEGGVKLTDFGISTKRKPVIPNKNNNTDNKATMTRAVTEPEQEINPFNLDQPNNNNNNNISPDSENPFLSPENTPLNSPSAPKSAPPQPKDDILNNDESKEQMGGTPLWMSPEALRGDKVDFKADVWYVHHS
jgi:hypothetical protein